MLVAAEHAVGRVRGVVCDRADVPGDQGRWAAFDVDPAGRRIGRRCVGSAVRRRRLAETVQRRFGRHRAVVGVLEAHAVESALGRRHHRLGGAAAGERRCHQRRERRLRDAALELGPYGAERQQRAVEIAMRDVQEQLAGGDLGDLDLAVSQLQESLYGLNRRLASERKQDSNPLQGLKNTLGSIKDELFADDDWDDWDRGRSRDPWAEPSWSAARGGAGAWGSDSWDRGGSSSWDRSGSSSWDRPADNRWDQPAGDRWSRETSSRWDESSPSRWDQGEANRWDRGPKPREPRESRFERETTPTWDRPTNRESAAWDRDDDATWNREPTNGRRDSEAAAERGRSADRDQGFAGEGGENPSYPERRYAAPSAATRPASTNDDPWAED